MEGAAAAGTRSPAWFTVVNSPHSDLAMMKSIQMHGTFRSIIEKGQILAFAVLLATCRQNFFSVGSCYCR